MAKTVTNVQIAKEDLNIGTSTFTRTQSDGTTGTYTQIDAKDIPGTYREFIDQSSAPAAPAATRARAYTSTADDIVRVRTDTATLQLLDDTNAQTIAGVKTFSSIPILPASNPTTGNQAARKTYVDLMAPLAGATFTGAVNVSAGGLSDASRRVRSSHTINTTAVSVTATIVETDLITASVTASTAQAYHILASGTVSGAAGTKRIRLYLGATAIVDTTAVSGTAKWTIEAFVAGGTSTTQVNTVWWSDPTNATNFNKDMLNSSVDFTSNVTVKCTGTLGNSGDTIQQTMFLIEALP